MSSDSSSNESESADNTPPRKKKVCYQQKYRKEWTEEMSWVDCSDKGCYFARCKPCNIDINVTHGKTDLKKHENSVKHIKACKRLKIPQKTIKTMFQQQTAADNIEHKAKEGVIRIAGFLAEHNLPLNLVDHLVELMKAVCEDSVIAKKIKCGRTKITQVIKNVTAKEQEMQLINLMKTNKFSIIVDESTDRSCSKHLCLVVRLNVNNNIKDFFLTLKPVQEATGAALYGTITKFFEDNLIPYKDNLIGFASDGANNMMGIHNSVMSRLRQDIPNIFIMKCICHSFHLCASEACKRIPDEVEQLVREIYNYFANSPRRIDEYKEMQEFAKEDPTKILKPAQTRWLSLLQCVKRVISHYNSLTLYFTNQAFNDLEKADGILQKLKRPDIHLYLHFLAFILPVFINLNTSMQSETPKIQIIYQEVEKSVKQIMDNYIKEEILGSEVANIEYQNPRNFLPIEEMYFGAQIEAANDIDKRTLHNIKINCLNFYIESITQIITRFPLKNSILKDFNFINPEIVLKRQLRSIANVANTFNHLISTADIQDVDEEWRSLRNDPSVKDFEHNDPIHFWNQVGKIKSGDDTPRYKNLVSFIFHLLVLPHSSAAVERIFSQVALHKTNSRNRLKTDTLSAILHTKTLVKNGHCFGFSLSKNLVKKLNDNIYCKSDSNNNNNNSDSSE